MSSTWKSCAICNSTSRVKEYLCVQDGSSEETTHILRCSECGLVYVNEPIRANVTFRPAGDIEAAWSQQFPDRLDTYADDAWGQTYQDAADVVRWQYNSLRKLVGDNLNRPDFTLLEIGAARAYFLAEVFRRHPNTTLIAVEPSPVMAKLAEKSGARVVNGLVEDAALQPESLDAVVGFGSFIQVRDPLSTLNTLYGAMKPGGRILLDTPNDDSLFRMVIRVASRARSAVSTAKLSKQLEFAKSRAYNPRRFFYYTKDTYRRLLAAAGFRTTNFYYRQPRYVAYGREKLPLMSNVLMRAVSAAEQLTGRQSWLEVHATKDQAD